MSLPGKVMMGASIPAQRMHEGPACQCPLSPEERGQHSGEATTVRTGEVAEVGEEEEGEEGMRRVIGKIGAMTQTTEPCKTLK
eukprot:11939438-Karenia_brevis.AAC.1